MAHLKKQLISLLLILNLTSMGCIQADPMKLLSSIGSFVNRIGRARRISTVEKVAAITIGVVYAGCIAHSVFKKPAFDPYGCNCTRSADGKLVAKISDTDCLKLYNNTGVRQGKLKLQGVRGCDFNDKYLRVYFKDGSMRFYDQDSLSCVLTLQDVGDWNWTGKHLRVTFKDGSMGLYDKDGLSCVLTLQDVGDWNWTGKHLRVYFKDGSMGLYDKDGLNCLLTLQDVQRCDWDWTGKYHRVSFRDGSMGFYDKDSLSCVLTLQDVQRCDWDWTGKYLKVSFKDGSMGFYDKDSLNCVSVSFKDGSMRFYDQDSLSCVLTLQDVQCYDWVGKYINVFFKDGSMGLYDQDSLKRVITLQDVQNCACSYDNKKVVVGFKDGMVARYNTSDMSLECWL